MTEKEVEVKVWLSDSILPGPQETAAGEMADILLNSGWDRDSHLMMTDTYLDHPCRDLAATDEAVRIRSVKDLHDGRVRTMITYKGPKISERSKARYEREVRVPDSEGLKDIFYRLGFGKVIKVMKERRTFTRDDMEACIDIIPDLGCFLEVELIEEDVEKAEDRILAFLKDWELDRTERRSYLELLLQK